MIRRLLLVLVCLLGGVIGCRSARELEEDMGRKLDDMNREAIESEEPVTPGGPLRDSRQLY